MNTFWDLLEIEPTTDQKEIRRAYARASKKYHPEEQPTAFQQVREAYEAALRYAQEDAEESDPFQNPGNPVAPVRRDADTNTGPCGAGGAESTESPASTPTLLLEEEAEEDPAQTYLDAPAMAAFQSIFSLPATRKDQRRWQLYFTSPEFLAVQREPGFAAALARYVRGVVEQSPQPAQALPRKFILELSIAYGIRHECGVTGERRPLLLPMAAFAGIDSIFEITALTEPIQSLDHEGDKIRAACFRDYFQLLALAKSGAFENPERTEEWHSLLSNYKKHRLTDKPAVTRMPEYEVFYRHPDGVRLIAYFLESTPLPTEVFHYLNVELDLPAMEHSSTRQLYKPLYILVREKLANWVDTGPTPQDIFSVMEALRGHLERYHISGILRHSQLMHSYDNTVTAGERRETETLLSLPAFQKCMLDPTFIRNKLIPEVCGFYVSCATPYFLEELRKLYEPHRALPEVGHLLETLTRLLHHREHDGEFFIDRPWTYTGLTYQEITLENREFWYYYLTTAFPAAISSQNDETLHHYVWFHYYPSWEWQKRFSGYDETTGRFPDQPCSLCTTLGEREVQARYHLHYIQYFVDGSRVNQQAIGWETMLSLADDDFTFWFMLPLTLARDEERRRVTNELMRRLESLPLDRETFPVLADMLTNNLCTPLGVQGLVHLERAESLDSLFRLEVYEDNTFSLFEEWEARRRPLLTRQSAHTLFGNPREAAVKRGREELLSLLPQTPTLETRVSVKGKTPLEKAQALLDCLGGKDYSVKGLLQGPSAFPHQVFLRYGDQPGQLFHLSFTLTLYSEGSQESERESSRLGLFTRIGIGASSIGRIEFGNTSYPLILNGPFGMLIALPDDDTSNFYALRQEAPSLPELMVKLLDEPEWELADWVKQYTPDTQ